MNGVKILFFASIREKIGKKSINIDIKNSMYLNDFLLLLKDIHPELNKITTKIINNETTPYMLVLNGTQIKDTKTTIVNPGSEFAILPPVSGG